MNRIYLILFAFASLCFGGCAFLHAPPDRVAFASIQFSDESLGTAYDVWVPHWQKRYDAAKAAADAKTMAILAKQREDVAKLVKAYQEAHRAVLSAAEKSMNSATNGVLVITLPDDNTKTELLHALQTL